jgi:hypothetical protein
MQGACAGEFNRKETELAQDFVRNARRFLTPHLLQYS